MRIAIKNARLAFPNIFQPKVDETTGRKSFGAALILAANDPVIAQIDAAIEKVAKEKWNDKAPTILKMIRAQDRVCLKDGDLKAQYAGFEGNRYVAANSTVRPSVFGANREPLDEASGKIYAGAYVNANIELWAQDHPKHGKRVNAQLRGVQFSKDGDAFAGGTAASEDEFEDLGDTGTDPLA